MARFITRLTAPTLLGAALLLVISVRAEAADGRAERQGACSGRSDWSLEVRREDGGRLRVRYEIEGGRAGQEWHVYLSDNGSGFFAGTRVSGSNGHVEVRDRTRDRTGADTITAGANNLATGETCGGRASL
jgi:hypothetical protein